MSADLNEDLLHRLEREISNTHGSIVTALDVRKNHPSFGETKRRIQAKVEHLSGMVTAWLYVTGTWDTAGVASMYFPDMAEVVREKFGFDPHELDATVKAA